MSRMLERDRTTLVVVDVQEAFRTAVGEFDAVARGAAVLVQGARALDVPVIATEQYPKGLGATVPEVGEHLDGVEPLSKTAFSACRAKGFHLGRRDQALVCGIEAHVCVSQTAHDLLERGVQVHVAADAVTSRTAANRRLGLRKMEDSGAILTSVETALFELLGEAGTPEFKTIQTLIK
ncbi:MAG TPA: isochorismatase family protein [Solirubrobacteraceae bacterium]|jgi:nicotinamidase-related amidase